MGRPEARVLSLGAQLAALTASLRDLFPADPPDLHLVGEHLLQLEILADNAYEADRRLRPAELRLAQGVVDALRVPAARAALVTLRAAGPADAQGRYADRVLTVAHWSADPAALRALVVTHILGLPGNVAWAALEGSMDVACPPHRLHLLDADTLHGPCAHDLQRLLQCLASAQVQVLRYDDACQRQT